MAQQRRLKVAFRQMGQMGRLLSLAVDRASARDPILSRGTDCVPAHGPEGCRNIICPTLDSREGQLLSWRNEQCETDARLQQ